MDGLILLAGAYLLGLPLGVALLWRAYREQSARVVKLEERVSDLVYRTSTPERPAASRAIPGALAVEPALAENAHEAEPLPEAEPAREPDASEIYSFQPEPEPEPEPAPTRESLASLFERLVGGRLLVWTGGIAIALAGLFLVRYSIELGLIGPRTRMIAAAVFGLTLLGAGEYARRRLPGDLRIGQALVGAGVLVLYAAAYGSHVLYGLIGLGTAFALMAAVAAAALVLSLRHGTPTAVLGLVAGFLTPLLVGRSTGEAAPLLGYLTLLNLAVFAVAVRSGRPWLGWAAKLMTLGWTGWLLASASDDALMIGLFLLVHTVATGLAATRDEPAPSLGPTLALLQMGAVVPLADYAPGGWALLFAFGVAGFALGDRSRVLAALPGRALTAALLLIAGQMEFGAAQPSAPYAVATTLLFAGGSWWYLERAGQRLWWTLIFCAAAAGPALLLRIGLPNLLPQAAWGALLAGLSLGPAALAWRMRREARDEAPFDRALLLAAATSAVLLAAAGLDLASDLWRPFAWMLVALGLLWSARRIGDGGAVRLALVAGGLASLAAAARAPALWRALAESLAGSPVLVSELPALAGAIPLFAAPGLVWLAIWRWLPQQDDALRRFAGRTAVGWAAAGFAAVAGYVLFKQIFALRLEADFAARGFAERTLLTQGLFFAGWMLAKRPRLEWLRGAALALTAVAAARFAWFDLLVFNPAWHPQQVGALPVLNLLVPAFLGSAFWLFEARRRAVQGPQESVFLALFLAALVVGAALLVRQSFQGAVLTGSDMPRAEFYGYSLAGLLLSVGLLMWGWRRADTPIRVAGLALLTATVVKVFVIDAAALEGVLRIASFLGLGVALIGMGKLYGTVLGRSSAPPS